VFIVEPNKQEKGACMESPVSITVFGRVLPANRNIAMDFLRVHKLYSSERELRGLVIQASMSGKHIQISHPMGLTAAKQLSVASSEIFYDITFCQEGYNPIFLEDCFCKKCNFYFAGMFGCHICSGFYRK
jgi:hypothetical protein